MLLSPHFIRKRSLLEEALPSLHSFLQALGQLEQAAIPTPEIEAATIQIAADLDLDTERRCWEDVERALASFRTLARQEKE